MSLVAPFFLGLLALVGLVILLHVQRRRTVTVPSVEIWRRLQNAGAERRRRFEWPRANLLMLLQIAIVTAIAFALAQPLLGNRGADHLVILLDGTPSMGASDGDTSRIELARSAIIDRFAALDPARVSLVRADHAPLALLARQPADADALAVRLDEIEPGGRSADWRDTAEIVAGLVVVGEATRILWASDTPLPAIIGQAGNAEIETLSVGAETGNAGLSLALVPDESVDGGWRLRGTVTLHAPITASALSIAYTPRSGGQPLVLASRQLGNPARPPRPDAPRVEQIDIPLTLPGPGLVTAGLAEDAAAFDNTAWFLADPAPAGLDILYLGSGNQPLLRALQAIEGVSLYQSGTLPEDVSRFPLVIVDGIEIARAPETSTLWIGAGRVAGMPAPEPVPIEGPTNWDNAHPLAEGLAWSELDMRSAFPVEDAGSYRTLLEAEGLPLILARTGPAGRDLRLAFDPADSNWPDLAGFPVFARNIVSWLGPMPGAPIAQACMVGQSCLLDVRMTGGTVTLDAGGPEALAGSVIVPALEEPRFLPRWPGLYTISNGQMQRQIAVGASADGESAIATAPETSGPSLTGVLTALWPWLAGLALVLLIAEGALAGRGPERFLKRAGLSSANPLAGRRRILLGLRGFAIGLVVLALLDVPVLGPTARENVVLVTTAPADGSAATGADLVARATAEATAPLSERGLSVVAEGAPARVMADTDAALEDQGFASGGGRALLLAAALLPEDAPGRIILASDTGPDDPELAAARSLLAARAIPIDVMPPATPAAGEALVQALEAPYPLYAGDSFALTGRIFAVTATRAEVSVLRDDELLAAQDVELQAGHNRIETMITDLPEGRALFEIEIAAEGDAVSRNNRNGLWIDGRAPGTIAVITQQAEQGAAFAEALSGQGFSATVLAPDRAPYTLADWLSYQGVALLNVPAIALTTRQQELLEVAVAQHGLGLMILGGANSFGPGGYLETTLEQLSPLSSRVPREAPEVALVFVLDRSGSMQQMVGDVTRLDVAKRATLAAIELLNEQSRAGIVVFDSEAQVILPLQTVGDAVGAEAALNRIDTGGGTSIYPGLVEAHRMLAGIEAPARHVIVMTDGLSQPGDFPGILARMREDNITVSAVAVGRGAELGTVESIALAGGGAFHASDDFAALPSILSQEAMLLSGSPIEETTSQPIWVGSGERFLSGLPGQMPPVEGFVLTTPKPEANVSLVAPDSESEFMPLLASWRYGNGHVLALATDAAGAWTRAWQALPAYPRLYAQALREFLPATSGPGLELTTRRDGDSVLVVLEAAARDGAARTGLHPVAEAVGPSGEPLAFALREQRQGRYEGRFVPPEPGDYAISVADGEDDATTRVHIAYPSRYDFSRRSDAALQLAAATGGRVLGPEDQIFTGTETRWVARAGWPVWMLGALGLFVIDLLVRYAGLYGRIRSLIPSRSPRSADLAPAPAPL
ncbi:VWA domain-containing protein [Arsenicitalea aurantiaca]|uniref:VWA domain-containing protein n=1 Tax=Arsenicitalea aurantiaca TaxID=1783274 RepID=A0A433XAD4_9HYPH|nr:VWA domain-containing protein [Arsenicitalea aurantiaca]RUT31051.1 VWA domain-containing protein [Arsenicitalea aurantiaca]